MFRRLALAVVCFTLVASAADLKYSKKIKDAAGEHAAMTFYFQGQRVRIDHRHEFGYGWKDGRPETIAYGPRLATIYQCDMHRVLELDFEHHQYTATEFDKDAALPTPAIFQTHPGGPKVKVTVESRDTGETRQMFGQTAHRIITTRKTVPSPGACALASETIEDGWYLDLDRTQQSCLQGMIPSGRAMTMLANSNCNDDYEVQHLGPRLPALPVEITETSTGAQRNVVTESVTDLSRLPLDPQLFDLPMGYKHVDKLDDSPNLPWLLRAKLMWQSAKTTVWGWTPWGK